MEKAKITPPIKFLIMFLKQWGLFDEYCLERERYLREFNHYTHTFFVPIFNAFIWSRTHKGVEYWNHINIQFNFARSEMSTLLSQKPNIATPKVLK